MQYAVASNTTFTIEATATDDVTQVADLTFNVCNPTVSVNVVPNMGATDTAARTATEMNLVAGTGRYNTRYSNCR